MFTLDLAISPALQMTSSAFDQAAAANAAAQQHDQFDAAAKAADAPERQAPFFHLSIRCWLPESGSKLHASMKVDRTKSGNGRVRFAAAPTAFSKEADKYLSGRLFTLEATDNGYGPLATAVLEAIAANERLVDIKAQYKPYEYTTDNGESRTADKWFIVEMNHVSRRDPAHDDRDDAPQVDADFQRIVDEANAAKADVDANVDA